MIHISDEFRKNATLTYLIAGKLKKVINIWIKKKLFKEEHALTAPHSPDA